MHPVASFNSKVPVLMLIVVRLAILGGKVGNGNGNGGGSAGFLDDRG